MVAAHNERIITGINELYDPKVVACRFKCRAVRGSTRNVNTGRPIMYDLVKLAETDGIKIVECNREGNAHRC